MSGQSAPEFLRWDMERLAAALRQKQLSPVEVTRALLDRIEQVNPLLNAFITVMGEEALASAARAEAEIAKGDWRGPLHGVPVGIKDLIYTRNVRTTMGTNIYENYVPDYDATVVAKLKEAGAVIIGKLNTHYFAYGPTGDRSAFGPVKNPHDLKKISGGSSSGSAAALAAGLCYAALGTDTGGSIRIPASCCGIVGMKPTYGLVSKHGVYPLSWSLDHVGPMTRTVKDNALLLNVLAGYDADAPCSVRIDAKDYTEMIGLDVKGTVVGVPENYYFEGVQPEVNQQVQNALRKLEELGARIRPVALPSLERFVSAQQMVIRCEAYVVHEPLLQEQGDLYEPEVKERLLTGKDEKAYQYIQAKQLRQAAIQEYVTALQSADVLVTPTLPILPPEIGQREIRFLGQDVLVRQVLTRLTSPTNYNGLPSLSVPCGFSVDGLPIGIQFIGKPWDEARLYGVAYALEQALALDTVKMDIQDNQG
mgnify:CR=1 FL=1